MLPLALTLPLAAALGAAFASFAAVVGERSVRGESVNGRSHCACGRTLTALELVPLVGWLRSRGRSQCCGVRIPASLLVGELAGFTIPPLAAVAFGVPGAVVAAAVVCVLVALHAAAGERSASRADAS